MALSVTSAALPIVPLIESNMSPGPSTALSIFVDADLGNSLSLVGRERRPLSMSQKGLPNLERRFLSRFARKSLRSSYVGEIGKPYRFLPVQHFTGTPRFRIEYIAIYGQIEPGSSEICAREASAHRGCWRSLPSRNPGSSEASRAGSLPSINRMRRWRPLSRPSPENTNADIAIAVPENVPRGSEMTASSP